MSGSDPVNTFIRAIVPLRVTPTIPKSMRVQVYTGFYQYSGLRWVPTQTSSPMEVPTTYVRYDLVYVQASDNRVMIRQGPEAPMSQTINTQSLPGEVPLAWVKLTPAMTTISEDDIIDARVIVNAHTPLSGGAITDLIIVHPGGGVQTDNWNEEIGQGWFLSYDRFTAYDLMFWIGTKLNERIIISSDLAGIRAYQNQGLPFFQLGTNPARVRIGPPDGAAFTPGATESEELVLIDAMSLAGPVWCRPQAEPTNPKEGMIYSDSATHKLRYYNGTIWSDIGG